MIVTRRLRLWHRSDDLYPRIPCASLMVRHSASGKASSAILWVLRCSEKAPAVLTTTVAYRMIAGNLDRSLAATAKKPPVARATEYYLANIGKVKSVDDLLADSRLYNYVTKAFGLQDMAYAKAYIKKVLTEGVDSREAFANKLTDVRYRELAETFNFARYGEGATVFDRTRQGTVDRYVRQTLEEDAGQQNQGARLALYFQRKAGSIKTPLNILADAALLKVVQTTLGLPAQMSLADIDRQAAMISAKLDVADLADPKKLKTFLDRFASLYELENPTQPPITPAILIGQSAAPSIGANILAALQNLKLGGR